MYKQGDKVLQKNMWKTKFNQDAYIGPYIKTAVRNNSTVRARKDRIMHTFSIRNQTGISCGPSQGCMTYTAVGLANLNIFNK